VIRDAQAGDLNAEDALLAIWRIFNDDLIDKLRPHAKISEYHFRDAVLSVQRQGYDIPHAVRRWIARQPEEALCYSRVEGSEESKKIVSNLFYFFGGEIEPDMREREDLSMCLNFGMVWGAPVKVGRLPLELFVNGALDFNVPPPEFSMEVPGLLSRYPGTVLVPTAEMSTIDGMVRHFARRERVALASPNAPTHPIDELSDLHLVGVLGHDLLHLFHVGDYSRSAQNNLSVALSILTGMGMLSRGERDGDKIAARIVDGQFQPKEAGDRALYRDLFAADIWRGELREPAFIHEFNSRLVQAASENPQVRPLLEAFQNEFSSVLTAVSTSRTTRKQSPDLPQMRLSHDGFARFLAESLAEIDARPSDLAPKYFGRFKGVLRRAQKGLLTPEQAVVELFQILHTDFAVGLKRVASFPKYSFRKFSLENERSGYAIPEPLRAWLERQGDAGLRFPMMVADVMLDNRVVTDAAEVEAWGDTLDSDVRSAAVIYHNISALGVLRQAIAPEKQFRLRMIAPKYLPQLSSIIYGDHAVEMVPTTRLSTGQEMREMVRRDQRPLLLSPWRQERIDVLKRVHSLNAVTHDVQHVLELSALGKPVREARNLILDILIESGIPLEERASGNDVVGAILDGSGRFDRSNNRAGYQYLFGLLRTDLEGRPSNFSTYFFRNLAKRFSGQPEGEAVMDSFREVFRGGGRS
jgi:hypothetical protein